MPSRRNRRPEDLPSANSAVCSSKKPRPPARNAFNASARPDSVVTLVTNGNSTGLESLPYYPNRGSRTRAGGAIRLTSDCRWVVVFRRVISRGDTLICHLCRLGFMAQSEPGIHPISDPTNPDVHPARDRRRAPLRAHAARRHRRRTTQRGRNPRTFAPALPIARPPMPHPHAGTAPTDSHPAIGVDARRAGRWLGTVEKRGGAKIR